MKPVQSLFALVLSLWLSCIVAQAEDSPEKAAAAAAEAWLGQIDAGNYAVGWWEASPYFQRVVTEKAWVESLHGVRKPLGNLVSRKLKDAQRTKSVSGAPDSDYVIMQFDTSFENKKVAIETVTFMQEKDGKWKATGYYIK